MHLNKDGETTGIYCIVNLRNQKRYIGSTTYSFKHRFYTHFYTLEKNTHHNLHLQRAWNKYGKKNFSFIILEKVKQEDCLAREQWYLDNSPHEYNLCKIAGAPFGYRHNLITLDKMSKFQQNRQHKPNTQSVEVENKNTSQRLTFATVKDAAVFLNMPKSILSNVLCGRIRNSKYLVDFNIIRLS